MENNSWKIVRTRLKFTRIHIFPHDLYMLFVLSDYFALIISKFKFGGTTLSTFYNRNFIFISKHKDKIDTIRKKFLILITGWPSKKIFFESKGLIPLIWSSLYVQDNDGLRLILITNERQKNRTDRLLRVNSRLEKGEKKKKIEKKKRDTHDSNVFVISESKQFRVRTRTIYFASFVDRWRGTKAPLLKGTNVNIWRG